MRPAGGWLWGGGLLALYWCVFVESNQGEHFAGFFAGLCVYEEVFHEDIWGGGVRGAVLVVEVFFDVVLFADCFERLGDLDCLAVGAVTPLDCGADAIMMSLRSAALSGSPSSSNVNLVGVRVTTASVKVSTPWRGGGF